MNSIRVLYDGWSLCRQPNSADALHLLAILRYLPDNIHPIVLFPETPPPWFLRNVELQLELTPPTSRLQWEQRILPQARRDLAADLIHLTSETASLLNGSRTVISPTQPEELYPSYSGRGSGGGLITRLRVALSAGGTERVLALFWPDDLPPPPGRKVILLPPVIHPDFIPDAIDALEIPGMQLPDSYVLYHGPDDPSSLRRALEAWTWVAGPVGQQFPLVMLGLGEGALASVEHFTKELNLNETVLSLPIIPPGWVAPLYRRAEAIFHPASASAWGGTIRHALACGKPIVAAKTTQASTLVGPAAILVEAGDTRRLGASVIGIIVKENLSAQLREAAIARSAGWTDQTWGEKLAKAYADALNRVS